MDHWLIGYGTHCVIVFIVNKTDSSTKANTLSYDMGGAYFT